MRLPRIAFVTTCKGRAEHIKRTLPKNLADNAAYENAVFVVLNYSSPDDLMSYLIGHHNAELASGRLVVYTYETTEPFKMAFAKNLAHRLGMREGATVLCNLDADNFTGPDFAEYIASRFEEPNIFLWAKMIPGVLPRGISGRIVVSAHDFLKVGGYDEKFADYAPDDKDFHLRLRRLGVQSREIHPRFLDAVRHNDRMRFKEYPHARLASEDDFLPDSDHVIVNYGKFGKGTVWRL